MGSPLTRPDASAAVEDTGWRLVLGRFLASVPVTGMAQALEVAAAANAACGTDADDHLRVDLRPDRVELALGDLGLGNVTERDAELAHAVADAVRGLGRTIAPPTGDRSGPRPAQALEIAIDAMDIAAIMPFWRAVLGYAGESAQDGPGDEIVDPARQLPTVWFQQMDEPRPQRNRIHLDVSVAHDEAERRVQAALDAGGVLVSDGEARAFWILADVEGNEICVCTWQDRERD